MNVLIVGKNSFIAQGIGSWFSRKTPAPRVDCISVRDDDWKRQDFSGYDVVVFAAALVHRPDVTDWVEYERINVQLPWKFAKLVKAQGVKQFVFFSTVSVYRAERTLPCGTVIDENTPLEPTTLYGKSKLQAENLLQTLMDDTFHVSIVRPAFVYGKGCRGRHIDAQNFLARKLPVLPDAFSDVKMGMVYIDNLAELVWLIANSHQSGIYHAQDAAPMSTCDILQTMAPGKRQIRCQWLFRPFTGISVVKRLFGGSAYSEEMSQSELGEYRVLSMAEGICRMIEGTR